MAQLADEAARRGARVTLVTTADRPVAPGVDVVVVETAAEMETALLERVHQELAALFPGYDINEVEVEITNELKLQGQGL